MNKRRLLLFSVFALLHITTSERSFIDGRCCNQSTRSLSFDNSFSTYETHRVQRFLPEIRQLNNPNKYLNSNERDIETTQLSRRRHIGFTKRGSRDNEIREIVERHEKTVLTNPIEETRERQNFRKSIRERSKAFRHNRFAASRDREYQRNFQIPSLSRNDNRINDVTRNRLENGDVNRHNYINRDARIRNDRDIRNEGRRNAREVIERNTEYYTNRINVKDDFDYVRYTKSFDFPQKSILERAVRLENSIRTKRSDSINVVNRLATVDRNSRFERYRDLNEDLSQYELSRNSFTRNNIRSEESMNLKDSKRRSVSDNQINRRLARYTDHLNPLIERRARSENVRYMARIQLRTDIRNSKLELQETSRLQRDYVENRQERETRTQSDRRQRLDRIDTSEEMENRLNIRTKSLEDKYSSRDRRNDARVQFTQKSVDDNIRYDRGINEREISAERQGRINIRSDRSREYMNSRQFTERNKLESKLSYKNRYHEGGDNRVINENRLSVRRSYIERALERDNKGTTRRNLSTEEYRVRDAISRSEKYQRNINDASDRMERRNREVFSYSPEIRERDESKRNLRESRYDRFIENRVIVKRENRQQSDNRHETTNDRIRNNNIERNSEKQFRLPVRQDQSRITSNTHRNLMTVRSGIQIARSNIEDKHRQRSRSLSNDNRLTGSREDTRKTDNESRQIRKTQEKPINMRRMATVINLRRESTIEFPDRKSLMANNVQYGNHVFEMKWQYLFYALQLVYLCSILMKIPKNKNENKHMRFADWFTPTEYLKID